MTKKEQIEKFFEQFIKNFLVGDIVVLDRIQKDTTTGLNACTIPQAMAVIAGTDLLGYLFGDNKKADSSKEHINEFYRIVNEFGVLKRNYDKDTVDKIVLCRHGMMHHFFPKSKANNIGICKSETEILFIKEIFEGTEIESLNVSVLTSDFISTIPHFESSIAKSSDDKFWDNILSAMRDLRFSNELASAAITMTTINIVPQNKRI